MIQICPTDFSPSKVTNKVFLLDSTVVLLPVASPQLVIEIAPTTLSAHNSESVSNLFFIIPPFNFLNKLSNAFRNALQKKYTKFYKILKVISYKNNAFLQVFTALYLFLKALIDFYQT